jgi:transcriptional regulator with XRE-family HTH domain
MPSRESTKTVGDFLRSHRERIQPAAVGFQSGRRRTPGLRREEVAQLCGVSTTWYTWLEQGRAVSASAGTLARIAQALRLTRAERVYLFEIAGVLAPESEDVTPVEIPSTLSALIADIPVPAYLLDRQWNAVAWNRSAAKLFKAWLIDFPSRNLLRFVFLSEEARELIVDWNERARRIVAEFRADCGRHLDDPPTRRVLEVLQRESRTFQKLWGQQDVKIREGGVRRLRANGIIIGYEQVAFTPSARSDLKLITLVPIQEKQSKRTK